MNRRVVITGIGIVSPLGNDRESTWQAVRNGVSGADYISQFDAAKWPTTFACEVKDFRFPDGAVLAGHEGYLSRPGYFGAAAALEAISDSGIADSVDPDFFGISIGANIGSVTPSQLAGAITQVSEELSARLPDSQIDPKFILRNHPGTLAGVLSARWQARGTISTIQTACASSGQSIGQGYLNIKRGDCDALLAGGADSLASELLLAGFCLLGALSTRNGDPESASRPFDKDRDGFVAGGGAAMLVLEERSHALARNAPIYTEIVGYGETESAFRITDLPPNGRGVVEAMHQAVEQSGLGYECVDYINAHGTSTELNDRTEALAVRRVFGSRGALPMVSSTKSETGHLISAAGAIELAFCALALRDQEAPPTINLDKSDCGDDIDFVANTSRRTKIRAAMSNSIGFGGSNSSLLLAQEGL